MKNSMTLELKMKVFQIKLLNIWSVYCMKEMFFFYKAMIRNEEYDVQRTLRHIHADGCPDGKQVKNIIEAILKLNINETLSEDNHKIHCYKDELSNRTIHGQYLYIEHLLFIAIAVFKTCFVSNFLIM